MTLFVLACVALGCAAFPALFYLVNARQFRPPPVPAHNALSIPRVSVLVPARNEEASIAACVEAVRASVGVDWELVVLDDHSDDRTADIVREIATKDARVRLEPAPPLPAGWCGKQHACFTLAGHARFPLLTFLDADVRLAPAALARLVAFQRQSRAELVSGFPRQETVTLLEQLVIPLIHWLLVCWLPLAGMRRSRRAAFGAGCGQWFLTTRAAYDAAGGHAAVRASLHDGLTLPRAYRRAGFRTDVCDATDLAACRMYRSAGGVWFGLAKNAREGMAATAQVGFWTLVLFCGQVLPFLLLLCPLVFLDGVALSVTLVAAALVYFTRANVAARFRQSALGEALHPVGVLVLLAIQWYAVWRAVVGRPVGWKGRAHPAGPAGSPPPAPLDNLNGVEP